MQQSADSPTKQHAAPTHEDDTLVVSSPTGKKRHVLARGQERALCGAKTYGWQVTTLVTVDCLRCSTILRRHAAVELAVGSWHAPTIPDDRAVCEDEL